MSEHKRKFPRITIQERVHIIEAGSRFKAVGREGVEVFSIVLDLAYGGASIKTNIKARLNSFFDVKFPSVGGLESFSERSEIMRIDEAQDSLPNKPRYLLGVKFAKPNVNRLEKFLTLCKDSKSN